MTQSSLCSAMASRGAAAALLMVVPAIILMSMLQVTSGAFHRPEGGEDGLYMAAVVVDEHGVERHEVKYLGRFEGNTTRRALGSGASDVSRRKLLTDSGVHCQSDVQLDGDNLHNAINGIATFFGTAGREWNTPFGYYFGHVIAYACNYGGNQWTKSDQVWSDHNDISYRCEPNSAGWYSREDWASALGRTVITRGYC